MSETPFSPSWYRVARLRPRLRNHDRITRHIYRGKITYILQDRISGQLYRFTPEVYAFVGLMDGERTVQDIVDALARKKNQNAPTQDQVIEILSGLHAMDALICDLPPDTSELFSRSRHQQQSFYLSQLKKSVLFFRIPLFDPEKILGKYSNLFAFLYTRQFLQLLAGLYLVAATVLFVCWQELTANLFDTLFTRNNLFILWLVYPAIKAVHELAHAFAVKKWGGEVHEIGVMFLLFFPVPYVNASGATAFADKWQRIAVSSAGILAELFLASLALLIWSLVEPGLTRTIAYNIIMLGGISTLIFNGNPLVRFDGYYVLSDLLEIPNLAMRSKSYLAYLMSRYLLGGQHLKPVPGSSAEKRWYLAYGIAAFLYRLTIYGSIFLVLSSKFSTIGALFGLFALGQLVLLPVFSTLRRIAAQRGNRQFKSRVFIAGTILIISILAAVSVIPLPYSSTFEGVLLPPEESVIRMQNHGTIQSIAARPNSFIQAGETVAIGEDLQLNYDIELLESQVREYQLRERAAFAAAPFEAKIVHERLLELEEGLKEKRVKREKLTLRSPAAGTLIVPNYQDLPGRFLQQGDILGYVLQPENKVRVVISQEDIDIITGRTGRIELTLATDLQKNYAGRLASDNPQATLRLPSKVLSSEGGGKILTDPADSSGLKMLEEKFQLDIAINTPLKRPFIGSRAFIRFYHGNEPLLARWLRTVRQLFLTHFHD